MMESWFMMVINRNRRAVVKNRANSASYSYAQARWFPRLDKSSSLIPIYRVNNAYTSSTACLRSWRACLPFSDHGR
jgi:hypothetical protein